MAFKSVFTIQEIVAFFDNYFRQIEWDSDCLEVMSKNTGHYWLIIHIDREDVPIMLLHKHESYQNYHKQCNCETVHSAIRKIKKHDEYVLKFRQ